MILTVTLNPLLEKKLYFKRLGSPNNRAYKMEYAAGGKGLNISRQLNTLGVENHALIFLGGANGKKLRSVLENENISFSVVSTKAETREATLVFDESKEKLTTYFGTNTGVTSPEIEKFLVKLEKAIQTASTVVFAGSYPTPESSIIIKKGLELCRKHDRISVLDTYGKELNDLIKAKPTILHNNVNELEQSLNVKLKTEKDKIKFSNYLYSNEISLSFLTNGAKPGFASKADFHYKIINPVVKEKDPTGSGDAFISAIIYGLQKALIFNDFVKLASAFGAVNASSWDVCKVKLNDAEKLTDKIEIKEIGKKMKIINDAPTIY